MKKKTKSSRPNLPLLLVVGSTTCSNVTFAHDVELHSIMSRQAAISSSAIGNLGSFAEAVFGVTYISEAPKLTYDSMTLDVIDWICHGSVQEDQEGSFEL